MRADLIYAGAICSILTLPQSDGGTIPSTRLKLSVVPFCQGIPGSIMAMSRDSGWPPSSTRPKLWAVVRAQDLRRTVNTDQLEPSRLRAEQMEPATSM